MRHPPYSPHLAPSILPTVSKFKETQRFSTNDELKYATKEWLKEQSELFYITRIQKLCEIAIK